MKKLFILLSVIILISSCKGREAEPSNQADNKLTDLESKDILGLRTCAYMVADLDSATKWYAEAFDTEPYFTEPFYVGFDIGGYELGLMPEENPPAEKPANVLTYWGVNDIDKVFEKLISLGAEPHQAPENVGGDLMVASVRDPWGNIIGIIYNPYFNLAE